MTFTVFVYILHSPSTCGAREPMSAKLLEALTASSSFVARVEHITEHEPSAIAGSAAGMVELDPAAVKEWPDLAKEVRGLGVNQVSCAMKHGSVLRRIVQNASAHGGFHVVLEDDCLYGDGNTVAARLQDVLWNLPSNYDITFLGLPTPQPTADSERFVTVNDRKQFLCLAKPGGGPAFTMPLLPCCESYVINPAAAARLLSLTAPIRFTAKLQLTFMIRKLALRCYASIPNIFVDGSKIGVYVSQQEPNNRLIWNDQFLKLERLCGIEPAILTNSPELLREAQELVDTLNFKGHPDMLRLLGKLQARLGNHHAALDLFEQAYTLFTQESCVLNSSSTVLRDHMSLYRHLQTDLPSSDSMQSPALQTKV